MKSSLMEHIRQLNRQSIEIEADWLDRLRYLGSRSPIGGDSPEIKTVATPQFDLEPPTGQVHAVPRPDILADGQSGDDMAYQAGVENEMVIDPDETTLTANELNAGPVPLDATALTPIEQPAPVKVGLHKKTTESKPQSKLFDAPRAEAHIAELGEELNRPARGDGIGDDAESIDFDDRVATNTPIDNTVIDHPAIDKTSIDHLYIYTGGKKDRPVDMLVNGMVDRFPAVAPASILLVPLDSGLDGNSVAARVAACLAARKLGETLLVDAHLNNRGLTELHHANAHPGLAEIINRNEPLHSLLQETESENLFFLPAGHGQVTHRKMDWTRISRLTIGLNRRFQYSIISGGPVGDLLTDVWSAYVDGVYLLVDVDTVDREHANDAVAHLRTLGARIIGCIVKEVDGQLNSKSS